MLAHEAGGSGRGCCPKGRHTVRVLAEDLRLLSTPTGREPLRKVGQGYRRHEDENRVLPAYPYLNKDDLIPNGYIAEKSGHSRGSTLDVTIVALPAAAQDRFQDGEPLRACQLPANERFSDNSLDMGTGFDCFDPRAHTAIRRTISKSVILV